MDVTNVETIPVSTSLPEGEGVGDARGFGRTRRRRSSESKRTTERSAGERRSLPVRSSRDGRRTVQGPRHRDGPVRRRVARHRVVHGPVPLRRKRVRPEWRQRDRRRDLGHHRENGRPPGVPTARRHGTSDADPVRVDDVLHRSDRPIERAVRSRRGGVHRREDQDRNRRRRRRRAGSNRPTGSWATTRD